jgi:hypothetical protein
MRLALCVLRRSRSPIMVETSPCGYSRSSPVLWCSHLVFLCFVVLGPDPGLRDKVASQPSVCFHAKEQRKVPVSLSTHVPRNVSSPRREARSLVAWPSVLRSCGSVLPPLWPVPPKIANISLGLAWHRWTIQTLQRLLPYCTMGTLCVFERLYAQDSGPRRLLVSPAEPRYAETLDPYMGFSLWLRSRFLGSR